jgi:hypothetical protein
LSTEKISIWFQNRRARLKKARKLQQSSETSVGGGNSIGVIGNQFNQVAPAACANGPLLGGFQSVTSVATNQNNYSLIYPRAPIGCWNHMTSVGKADMPVSSYSPLMATPIAKSSTSLCNDENMLNSASNIINMSNRIHPQYISSSINYSGDGGKKVINEFISDVTKYIPNTNGEQILQPKYIRTNFFHFN